jgi:hypothetical protein
LDTKWAEDVTEVLGIGAIGRLCVFVAAAAVDYACMVGGEAPCGALGPEGAFTTSERVFERLAIGGEDA